MIAVAAFTAAQDEKAMAVLSIIGRGWRLFWVLEGIGVSFGLALLVVKLTGNDDAINKGRSCDLFGDDFECSIYSWLFLLNLYPLAVTIFSLMVARICSRWEAPVIIRMFGLARINLGNWLRFSVIMFCLISSLACSRTWWAGPFVSFSLFSFFVMIMLVVGGASWCKCRDFARKLNMAYARGSQRFRPVDEQRRRWLFWSGFVLMLIRALFESVVSMAENKHIGSHAFQPRLYYAARAVFDVLDAVFFSAIDAWIVCGMELAVIDSPRFPRIDSSRALLPALLPMLIGWYVYQGQVALAVWRDLALQGILEDCHQGVFFAVQYVDSLSWLVCQLAVGTLLWGWTLELRAIAYWQAASRLTFDFLWCVGIVLGATTQQVVT